MALRPARVEIGLILSGYGELFESGCELFEAFGDVGADDGLAMTGEDRGGCEEGELLDRGFGGNPVGGVVGGRAVEFGLHARDRGHALGLHGAEGVPNDQGAFLDIEERDVAGGVPGGMEPVPPGHEGNVAFGVGAVLQRSKAVAEVNRAAGVEGRHDSHDTPADAGIGRAVGLFTGEEGHLEWMGVDLGRPRPRRVPVPR